MSAAKVRNEDVLTYFMSLLQGNMKKHIESVHMQDEPQQCGFCERKFKNKKSLQNRISLITANFEKSLTNKIFYVKEFVFFY